MKKVRYLIIGNSAGGIGAAEAIRRMDTAGSLAIVSDELHPAYSRPLIAEHIFEKRPVGKMLYREPDFYENNRISTFFGKKAAALDANNHTLTLADKTVIAWEKLLLATGGEPIIPAMAGINARGVFTFTTLADADRILAHLQVGQRAVVIGGGLIGMSVTDALVKCGVSVTIVEMKDRVLNTLLDETGSGIAAQRLKENDVRIITGHTVKEINSDFTTEITTGATLDDGREINCDMVIIAVGVKPRVELATAAGIKVNRGIIVNRFMQTSVPDIYACGDAAEAFDFVYGENRVTPIWPNAVAGGYIAGLNMAGKATEYAGGAAMNSIKYLGLSIVSAGMVTPPDNSYETVSQQRAGNYRKLVLKDGIITGMILAGEIETAGIIFGLMKDKVNINVFKQHLLEDYFSFLSLPEAIWRQRLETAFMKTKAELSGAGARK